MCTSLQQKCHLDYSKMRGHKDRVSYYEIAKNNGYHLVTVLNILKGRTRRKDTEKLCERFKLQLPWQ
jgi:hypothetical protein